MNIAEEKAKIRKVIKQKRADLSSDVLKRIEKDLPEFVFAIEDEELRSVLSKAKRVAFYRPFKGEVPTDELAKAFMAKGIRCCFPRIVNDDMLFMDCQSLADDEFEVSSFGIKEPKASKEPVSPKDIDVVVLPAVAYNEEGIRLGMGGGYYDRFIASFAGDRPYLMGICYEFQICSDVPSDEHDMAVDFIAVIPAEAYEE